MGKKAKKHGKRRKRRTHVKQDVLAETTVVPRSFVFARGDALGDMVPRLVRDLRNVMMPYTAVKLREKKGNKIKDFIAVAGPLKISHFLVLKRGDRGLNLRILRIPHGPTITFRVDKYSLCRDLVKVIKRPRSTSSHEFDTPPLIVLNNFGNQTQKHLKLVAVTFQNLFPAINVKEIKLSKCRRVVLVHYIAESDQIEVRHYSIQAVPTGLNRSIKRVLQTRIPKIGSCEDISDFVFGPAQYLSESEAEEPEENRVVLNENYVGAGNVKNTKSGIRLTEIGPRLTLTVHKIQENINTGETIYNKFVEKTKEEIAEQKAAHAADESAKKERRELQEANVKRKQEEKEAKKKEKKEKKERKERERAERQEADGYEGSDGESDDDDSDNKEKTKAPKTKNKKKKAQSGGTSSDSDSDSDSDSEGDDSVGAASGSESDADIVMGDELVHNEESADSSSSENLSDLDQELLSKEKSSSSNNNNNNNSKNNNNNTNKKRKKEGANSGPKNKKRKN